MEQVVHFIYFDWVNLSSKSIISTAEKWYDDVHWVEHEDRIYLDNIFRIVTVLVNILKITNKKIEPFF